MSHNKYYIAIDLGAESGRVMIGTISDGTLSLSEVHRFPNGPVEEDNTIRWDIENTFGEIKKGLKKAIDDCPATPMGIGIDAWGVDYGLIDAQGKLVEKPFHYRDSRTDEMMDACFQKVPKRHVYDETGIQFMQPNTIFQLLAARQSNDDALSKATSLLFIPDLITFFLSGHRQAEYTIASTSGLLNPTTRQWHKALFSKLDLPINIMPEIIMPGKTTCKLSDALCTEFNCEPIDIITTGCHDTANAVASVPVKNNDSWAYLSSGTWSLVGIETDEPIINNTTYDDQFTNEGGVEGKIRLLKNLMGLWILQECRRQWQRDGVTLDYTTITKMAADAVAFEGIINPNNASFFAPGDMPARVNDYLSKTGQTSTDDKGQICRIILESLALKYRWTIEKLEKLSGKPIDTLHIVGGGTQNKLLNQFAANAINRKVVTGPIEATACGNILMQAIATKTVSSLAEGRKLIGNSFEVETYLPDDAQTWNDAYTKATSLFNQD